MVYKAAPSVALEIKNEEYFLLQARRVKQSYRIPTYYFKTKLIRLNSKLFISPSIDLFRSSEKAVKAPYHYT
ncbi:hypothetical protein QTP88_014267 [Uroleucon formosanum]